MSKRCSFFLQDKQRFCKFECRPGFDKCGNHINGTGAAERVPCPVDPRHTVLQGELDWHVPRCPKAQQIQEQQAQSYYSLGCNAGSTAQSGEHATDGPDLSSASERTAYARSLGPDKFSALLARIERAYDQVCGKAGAAAEEVIPGQCVPILEGPSGQPLLSTQHVKAFAIKHARQQAAILGQMQRAGLLQDPGSTTFVELGAGKGYLSCMLAESFGAGDLILVDRDGFRLTADRTLRRLGAKPQRVKVDIKDFEPAGLPSVAGGQPWVAMGKHLCGAATDFTLCCAARCAHFGPPAAATRPLPTGAPSSSADHRPPPTGGPPSSADLRQPPMGESSSSTAGRHIANEHSQSRNSGVPLGNAPVAGSESALEQLAGTGGFAAVSGHPPGQGTERRGFLGCAVATCCHHRCTWKHYVGKSLFSSLGFSPAEFELISWMTGWALCGHGRPRDSAADAASLDDEDASAGGRAHQAPTASCSAVEASAGLEQARDFEPSMSLPRESRQALGAQCKRLIDAGRRQYLLESGFSDAEAVQYVSGEVSGENWMLLATC